MRKGQAGLIVMIAAMAFLLVLYSYFLPLSEKCKLIPSLPDCKAQEEMSILKVSPGLLEEQETAARYAFPKVELFRIGSIDISSILESTEARKGWFFSAPSQGTFEAQENGRSAKLFIFINKGTGGLKIFVNGKLMGTVYGEGVHSLFIAISDLNQDNTIKAVPTTPLFPFISNSYDIGKIILKEEYTITNNVVSRPFMITENPENILDITLKFSTRCPTEQNLTVFIGDEKVTSDKICRGFSKEVTSLVERNNYSGNITFTSEGNYVVNDINLDIRMKERTWPTYYFHFTQSNVPVIMNLKFNGTGSKELTAYINGNAISVETTKKEWQTAVNKYLIANSTNSVLLIPKKEVIVDSLEVM